MQTNILLAKLPPFMGKFQLISKRQTVGEIIREVIAAHQMFYSHYDAIANDFYYSDPVKTFQSLFSFLKGAVVYNEESEESQTVTSPAGILAIGKGDCKHYASFIGGVLDALKRKGMPIKWKYRFANYDPLQNEPGHVFVVAEYNGREYWIDPVLKNFDQRLQPVNYTDKKIVMPLYRVSGVAEEYAAQMETLQAPDGELDPEIIRSIQILIHYGVMSETTGKINDKMIEQLHNTLPVDQFTQLMNARIYLHNAAIGGLFATVWRGFKKVTLFAPRAAFLSLVNFNVFGYASKLKRAVWDLNGNPTEAKNKIKDLWQNKFGGDWAVLEKTIKKGAGKRAILGAVNGNVYMNGKIGAAPAAVPAWVATASAIIAALMPLVNAFLKKQQSTGFPTNDPNMFPYGVCADGFTPKAPDGSCAVDPTGGTSLFNDPVQWVKENPVLAAGIGVGGYYLVTKFL